jgi:hypothetical protein
MKAKGPSFDSLELGPFRQKEMEIGPSVSRLVPFSVRGQKSKKKEREEEEEEERRKEKMRETFSEPLLFGGLNNKPRNI